MYLDVCERKLSKVGEGGKNIGLDIFFLCNGI